MTGVEPGEKGSGSAAAGSVLSLESKLEEKLLGKAQAGDRDALRQLLTPAADALYSRVILPRVGDAATAEDIEQRRRAFVRKWRLRHRAVADSRSSTTMSTPICRAPASGPRRRPRPG